LAGQDELVTTELHDRLWRSRCGTDDGRRIVRFRRIGLTVLVLGQVDERVAVQFDGDHAGDDAVAIRLAQRLDCVDDEPSGIAFPVPADAGVIRPEEQREETANDRERGDCDRSPIPRRKSRHGPKVAERGGRSFRVVPQRLAGECRLARRRRLRHDDGGTTHSTGARPAERAPVTPP
jgi:hypothetical protein